MPASLVRVSSQPLHGCNKTLATCSHGPLRSPKCGLTLVMPTMGRRQKIAELLFSLLLHPLMQRPTSEILLSHGSPHAWSLRDKVARDLEALYKAQSRVAGPWVVVAPTRLSLVGRANLSKVRHLDGSLESARIGAAERYLAAGRAVNEVIIHVDDDVLPDGRNFQLISHMFCAVHAEPGFPHYADGRSSGMHGAGPAAFHSVPGLHGPTTRYCGRLGYGAPSRALGDSDLITLTNLAATPRAAVLRFLRVFDSRYRPLMALTRGDGEDIVFADAVRRAGGRMLGFAGYSNRSLTPHTHSSQTRATVLHSAHHPRPTRPAGGACGPSLRRPPLTSSERDTTSFARTSAAASVAIATAHRWMAVGWPPAWLRAWEGREARMVVGSEARAPITNDSPTRPLPPADDPLGLEAAVIGTCSRGRSQACRVCVRRDVEKRKALRFECDRTG